MKYLIKKQVFISYYFGDATFKGEIEKWLEEAGAKVISVDENDLRPEGDKIIEKRITEEISTSAVVIILVGNDSHNRPWVNYEVAVARSKQIPTYCIRLPNRTGASPKEVRGLEFIEYDKTKLLYFLKQLSSI